jgi:hypothetical protein
LSACRVAQCGKILGRERGSHASWLVSSIYIHKEVWHRKSPAAIPLHPILFAGVAWKFSAPTIRASRLCGNALVVITLSSARIIPSDTSPKRGLSVRLSRPSSIKLIDDMRVWSHARFRDLNRVERRVW